MSEVIRATCAVDLFELDKDLEEPSTAGSQIQTNVTTRDTILLKKWMFEGPCRPSKMRMRLLNVLGVEWPVKYADVRLKSTEIVFFDASLIHF